jgi:nucleotide-binding universal stress UspA family protein
VNPTSIVCPVDLSSSSRAALAHALSLARWHDAALHAVHVRPGRRRSAGTGGHKDDEAFQDRLGGFIDALNPRGASVAAAVLTGDPVSAVAEYAARKSADLVVVAQHGRLGRGYRRAGAFATAVGRGVECPTIAVPDAGVPPTHGDPHALFRNILCAVDFSSISMRALREALTLAQQSAGRITLLHVLEGFPRETVYSGGRALRLIEEYRARVERINGELHLLVPPGAVDWCEVDAETVSGAPHDAIVTTAGRRGCDLVVMGLPRRPHLERLVTGSTVNRVLRRAPCPVLMVPGSSAAWSGMFHSTVDRAGKSQAPDFGPARAAGVSRVVLDRFKSTARPIVGHAGHTEPTV